MVPRRLETCHFGSGKLTVTLPKVQSFKLGNTLCEKGSMLGTNAFVLSKLCSFMRPRLCFTVQAPQ